MESIDSARQRSVIDNYDRSALPVAESSLSLEVRLRLALLALAISFALLAACGVLGLVIRAALFNG
jgi:hypothetical protein